MPCEDKTWREPRVMERCESCSACLRKCPSQAIPDDRFLLRAERCLVYHNEQPGDVAFPSWVEPGWHNCLVGCLHCQTVCPENAGVLGWIEDGTAFSAVETSRLVAGVPLEELPEETAAKLVEHDLVDLMDLLPRNLGALFEARSTRSGQARGSAYGSV
jgi:epoxyqueuosine reductase